MLGEIGAMLFWQGWLRGCRRINRNKWPRCRTCGLINRRPVHSLPQEHR